MKFINLEKLGLEQAIAIKQAAEVLITESNNRGLSPPDEFTAFRQSVGDKDPGSYYGPAFYSAICNFSTKLEATCTRVGPAVAVLDQACETYFGTKARVSTHSGYWRTLRYYNDLCWTILEKADEVRQVLANRKTVYYLVPSEIELPRVESPDRNFGEWDAVKKELQCLLRFIAEYGLADPHQYDTGITGDQD
jgi:hypothetical protein